MKSEIHAARTGAGYVAFVASKVKAQKVLEYLREAGVPAERVSQIRAPAGLNLRGARAKAVAAPKKSALPVVNPPVQNLPVQNNEARDPVCGMFVNVSGAKYKSEHNGSEVYFCCAGCKQAFDRQPEKYTLSMSS